MGVFVVSVVCGTETLLPLTAMDVDDDLTFVECFVKIQENHPLIKLNLDLLSSVKMKKNATDNGIMASSKTMKLSTCTLLSCKFLDFIVSKDNTTSDNNNNIMSNKNAFELLMSSQKQNKQPPKPTLSTGSSKLTGPQKLKSDLIDWVSTFDPGWTPESLETGKTVILCLSNALWTIDHCHKKFQDNGCPVPDAYKEFQNYNNFAKVHHKAPIVTSEKLNDHCMNLSKCLSFPSMTLAKHSSLANHIETLLKCLTNYKNRLDKDNERHKSAYQKRAEPSRSVEEDATCKLIHPKSKVEPIYESIDKAICEGGDFKFIDVDKFCPMEREKRRKFINNLQLSKPIILFRMAYGGNMGTLNFIWGVPLKESPNRDELNAKIIASITKTLPKYSTRGMRREFINTYIQHIKTPKSLLRHVFHTLTESEPANENANQRSVNENVAQVLLDGDDPQLLLDYRALNGNKQDDKYRDFFNEMGKYFDEQLLPVQERRHGDELYLPLAISVEDLKAQIEKRLPPGSAVPSTETVRLQFMPMNPFQKTALKYTGRFNVKFRVQTRQARVNHPDGRYVATMFRYLKQFCVKYKHDALFMCLDDKAIVPVGEPGIPISTGVRGHNKVMVPESGPSLVAADHDFHVAGLVPSVALVTTTPTSSNDSFFNGRVYVTTKDKVFQPSHPFRHSTELVRILREHHSNDDVNLKVPILCLMTDGGPDHRVTYETVKLSLVQLFMQLDLDMLVAIRTAPNHSWTNPAERCMSLLNLALQHVALSRKKMSKRMEDAIKHKSSLNAVRNATSTKLQLKEEFGKSMEGVVELVNGRFSRMKLKGIPVTTYTGVSEDDIAESVRIVNDTTGATDNHINAEASSKDIKKSQEFQEFIQRHGHSEHYSFQLKKCKADDACQYCVLNPVRSSKNLDFLPCPVPDGDGQHYQTFDELYGKEVDGSHRPSSKSTEFDDFSVDCDKKNRDILKAVKARDAIKCVMCGKPRVVYSASKMTREQDAIFLRLKEENYYECGAGLPDDSGLVTRRSLSCTSEIEINYYAHSVRSFLPPCCVYCGALDNLLDNTHEYIEKLLLDFSCVRPLCESCRDKGLDAKTWGRKFFKKRKT